MESIRCGSCRKLLAKAVYRTIEIKCPRCGAINHLRAASPASERPRASHPMEDALGQSEAPSSTHSRYHPPSGK
ncbi:Com family DNA-binding transcriptional regulator [Telmatospirillum sp. J64-1]|uniref:Com family DNA-binding transcriptional regulator n=1 Tax=Telmatospirillum sp. J64-1 TaxID=2502183 RepID=UPI00115DA158